MHPVRGDTRADSAPSASVLRWVGGANVPTQSWRINGTWPFGVLEVSQASMNLVLRPKWLGGVPLRAVPADLVMVFPIRGSVSGGGVGFTSPDGREWCFWTRRTAEVMKSLAERNFPVSTTPRRPSKVWKGVP